MRYLKTFFALVMLALAVSASSCRGTKWACKKLDQHPTERAEYCASKYTPVEKTKTTVKYLPGKPVKTTSVEYVTVDCDSVVKAAKADLRSSEGRSKIVKVPVPTYLQVDTSAILLETERENVAALAYKDSVIASKDRDLTKSYARCDKADNKASSRLKWAFGGWGLSLLLIAFLSLLFTGKFR